MVGFNTRVVLPIVLSGAAVVRAVGPVTSLVLTNSVVSPDSFKRMGVTVNGSFVGPTITGKVNDDFKINVINQLDDPDFERTTTVHWHGLTQDYTNWADGTASVTQCPIAPNASFVYEFKAHHAGTFWYHSHLSSQYCDGLRGPFIVYDDNDPHKDLYDVDDESTIITLTDWYHLLSKTISATISFGIPDSALINGVGRHYRGVDTKDTKLAVITVQQGKRYRFRLINMACDSMYRFFIDQHDMDLIEVDGTPHNKLTVDNMRVYAGQRYSFVLNANKPVGNYWIRSKPNAGLEQSFINGMNSAILRYEGAPDEEPAEQLEDDIVTTNPLKEQRLSPLETRQVPGEPRLGGVDYALHLQFGFNESVPNFLVNGQKFAAPSSPVLLQILSGVTKPSDIMPGGTLYALPMNSSIELSMSGGILAVEHPMHLHGHSFDVVRVAGSKEYNYVNPPHRDVVNTGTETDNVTIRFRTDNPGPWFLHCHIDWHLVTGMGVIFAEGMNATRSDIKPPAAWGELCDKYNALPSDVKPAGG
ncbi:laccase [Marasmius fiardii PR-910]|nr:laccase [Marasmius fiardii PR-910]